VDREQSNKQLVEELASLRQEVVQLRKVKTAFDTQNELLTTLVKTAQTASPSLMLKAVLQQSIKIASRLTEAQQSSLFLLDANGTVKESILARGAIIREMKQSIIGMVLDKGLAGWVVRHRQTGLIIDTKEDERWLTLPDEPYSVRSALSVPICRGKVLLGIVTLMHSQPGHFTPETAKLLESTAEQIGLVLENAQLYLERPQPAPTRSHQQHLAPIPQTPALEPPPTPSPNVEQLSLLGIYIVVRDGRFVYTNPGLSALFGYSFIEFISIGSIFELVALNQHELIADRLNQCFQDYNTNLSCTFKGVRKDGSLINIEIYGTKTKFNGKSVIIGVLSAMN
jgi:PAS domain S-box-containing protein